MKILLSIVRKLFLVKEIISKEGLVHFRRYRLLETPWFRIYIHQICRSDEDRHLHTHPWDYISLLLKGSYEQEFQTNDVHGWTYHSGLSLTKLDRYSAHRITLHTPEVWTLFFAHGKRSIWDWGYMLDNGAYIDHKVYRELKNEGKL